MTRVVLASASPGRRTVLRQAGIDPVVVVSGVDEDAVIAAQGRDAQPGDVANALARAKAEQVADSLDAQLATDCVVIGCDSMLYIDGRLRGKPDSVAAARRQWEAMSGRSGLLYTGHCIVRLEDAAVAHTDVESACTTIHFGTPSEADLTAYLASGESLNVAGGFTIDGLGGWFIDGIEGDPSNVVGLGLPTTRGLLARAGLSIAELWADNPL
ncbi:MAG: Maf family protein [Mycobacterium sp.]